MLQLELPRDFKTPTIGIRSKINTKSAVIIFIPATKIIITMINHVLLSKSSIHSKRAGYFAAIVVASKVESISL